MKTYDFLYEGLIPLDNLTNLVSKDDILFFDIETTGLSKQKNYIYLIGVGYYTESGLKILQWFAENENEELNILREFLEFSSSFMCLVNYNGKSFDIPFTTERLSKYGLAMPDFKSIDIYTEIKPLKHILSLHDMTQKSIETFLRIQRKDKYNGGELISVYKSYVSSKSDKELELLLLHNKEDVLNMHYITEILDYSNLPNITVSYKEHIINQYTDYNGLNKSELLIYGLHNSINIPQCFNTFKSNEIGSFIMSFSNKGELQIRLPILETKLHYYFENYKDYYYLPNEDICILKSMAGGVLKENRENATRENCKVSLFTNFIPLPQNAVITDVKIFKDSYKSKQHYIRLDDYIALSMEQKDALLNLNFKYFLI